MSATIARLLLSVIALVATPAIYMGVFVIVEEWMFSSDRDALWVTNLMCGAMLALAWLLIWRGEVKWTDARRALTVGSLLLSIIAAGILAVVLSAITGDSFVAVFTAPLTWAILWLTATVLIWRETAEERAARLQRMGIRAIACPKCGYNLTGLRTSECPECGAVYTLDGLFAALAEERGTLPEETRV